MEQKDFIAWWKGEVLDFTKGNPNFGCRKLAEIFKIRKAVAGNILKDEKSICSQHELFCEKSKKHNWPDKYQKVNYMLVVSEMLGFEYLSKWPNAERRGNGNQRKSSGQ